MSRKTAWLSLTQNFGGIRLTCSLVQFTRRAAGFRAETLVKNVLDACLPTEPMGRVGCQRRTEGLVLVAGLPPTQASSDAAWEPPQRRTTSAQVSVCLMEATYTYWSPRCQPIHWCFFSFRRKWAFPVSCLNQTSSNAAWDFLS